MQPLEFYKVKVAPVLFIIVFPYAFISWHRRTWAITWVVPPEYLFAPLCNSPLEAKWLPQAWAGAGWSRQHAEWRISDSGKICGSSMRPVRAEGQGTAGCRKTLSSFRMELSADPLRERKGKGSWQVCLFGGGCGGVCFCNKTFDHLRQFQVKKHAVLDISHFRVGTLPVQIFVSPCMFRTIERCESFFHILTLFSCLPFHISFLLMSPGL